MIELPEVEKGKADWRTYRCVQLDNGVTVCLVHDKESKTTAAAATVKVGAGSDPRSMPGLAHFCEHMVFLGSEKYPVENEYKQYLARHGGRSNASTSMHLTTYKFEVLADYAEQAIDIFSNFFVGPLFTKSGTQREVNAVDSENSKNLTADVRRRMQILKDLCNDNVYFSKFSTGNSRTLPTQEEQDLERIREALLTFHRKHYRPDNLTVVVAGPQSLDDLQEWLVPRFGNMTTREFPSKQNDMSEIEKLIDESAADAPPFGFNDPVAPSSSPFRPELQKSLPALLTVNPVRSMRLLVMMFVLPSVHKVPDRSPTSVLSHLLGHEGPNSPFALLQNEGLITSLSAGNRFGEPSFSLFQLEIALTELGESRWRDVVDVILQYGRFLHREAARVRKEGGKTSRLLEIWEENIALSRIFFDQTSPGQVYSLCPSLCSSIVKNGTQKSMSAGYMLDENASTFPIADIESFASSLVASNCLIERCSKEAWEDIAQKDGSSLLKKTEKWYDVEYYLADLDKTDVSKWSADDKSKRFLDARHLALPSPNRFIPRSLELCSDLPEEARAGPRIDKEMEPPRILVNDSCLGRLWHRLDDRYALPTANLTLFLANAAVENTKLNGVWCHDPKQYVRSTLLANMFNQALAQETYAATLAGLSWNLSLSAGGINLNCSGFSDRLSELGLEVLDAFLKPSFITESHFSGAKDRLTRSLRTFFESRRADSHASYYRNLILDSSSEDIEVTLHAAEDVSLEDLRKQHDTLLQNSEVFLDCLLCGNVSERDARTFFQSATSKLMEIRSGKALAEGSMWIPGPTETRLAEFEDIELHFSSKNPHEENGALVMTFQSSYPGFRGAKLSSTESLKSSSSIRLLCQILREPFFDELRTKQATGYIVHSYYDNAVSLRPADLSHLGPLCVPVDFITMEILSGKVSPPELKSRVDDFLVRFRDILSKMPDSEIQSHASALSTKMLKPIQNLSTEVSTHLTRIRRYAPEVFMSGGAGNDLPWNSTKEVAEQIQKLGRQDLLETWDSILIPRSRSRVTSMVYGSSFPLKPSVVTLQLPSTTITNRISDALALRKTLPPYDDKPSGKRSQINYVIRQLMSNRSYAAVAAASLFGVGFIGFAFMTRAKKRSGSS
ncbi:hypothetical protein ACA910_017769 [Epithemia clementina (nom. ined.)]